MVFTVTDQTFHNLVSSPDNVVVIVGAPSRCPGCVKQHEIMDEFTENVKRNVGHYPPLYFANLETNPWIDANYGQDGVPRAFVFRNGELVFDFIGMFSPFQLEELLFLDADLHAKRESK